MAITSFDTTKCLTTQNQPSPARTTQLSELLETGYAGVWPARRRTRQAGYLADSDARPPYRPITRPSSRSSRRRDASSARSTQTPVSTACRGQLVNGVRRYNEPRSDSHSRKSAFMDRAIESVLVASENLRRFPNRVERRSPRDLLRTHRDHLLSNRLHEAKQYSPCRYQHFFTTHSTTPNSCGLSRKARRRGCRNRAALPDQRGTGASLDQPTRRDQLPHGRSALRPSPQRATGIHRPAR